MFVAARSVETLQQPFWEADFATSLFVCHGYLHEEVGSCPRREMSPDRVMKGVTKTPSENFLGPKACVATGHRQPHKLTSLREGATEERIAPPCCWITSIEGTGTMTSPQRLFLVERPSTPRG